MGLTVLIAVGLIATSLTLMMLSMMNVKSSMLVIPQPFVENSDFMHFTLKNKLEVLLIKPNARLNNTFICELTSTFCWSGF